MRDKHDIFARFMLCLGAIATVAVLTMTFLAIRRFAAQYAAIRDNDLTQDSSMAMIYDDRLYAQIAYGIEIVSGYKDMVKDRDDFLDASLPDKCQQFFICMPVRKLYGPFTCVFSCTCYNYLMTGNACPCLS
jgi:hypothetical protein